MVRGGETPILTLDQLPESKRAIIAALKERGSATIAQLAPALQLTGEAVRQQLVRLQREGWVQSVLDRAPRRARTGRPASVYRLTDAGEHLFPKHYDSLTLGLIDAVVNEVGAEEALRVLARVWNDRVNELASMLEGMTLERKVAALRCWYFEEDPYMASERDGDDFRLIERNCPYYNTAMARPALCSVSVNALTRLLGVRVAREEKFQSGDARCVFHAYAHEPIDAATWEFAPEP